MPDLEEPLKKELMDSDPEFRGLYEKHQSFERRLEELNAKSLLSEEDELEEKTLKRQKLFLKDRMHAILRHHRESVPA